MMMKRLLLFGAYMMILLLCGVSALWAAAEKEEEYQTQPMQVVQPDIATYRMGVDDIISIFVWRHPEVSTGGSLQQGALGTGIQVTTDGYITYPFLGRIYVVGMSLEDLRLKILDALKDIYRNPVVTVGIAKRRMFRLYVLGEVIKPGLYDMEKPEITITEALALAGGLKPGPGQGSAGAVSRATLQRGKDVIPLDLSGLVYRGEAGPNIMIRPEDRLIIPEQRKRIAVIGEVQRQGLYDIRDENTVLDAIALAGGYNNRAKPQSVAIIRRINGKNEVIPVNTRAIFSSVMSRDKEAFKGRMVTTQANLTKEELTKNIELQDRDIVYVPQINVPSWADIVSGATFIYYMKLFFPNVGN
jgi:polysaccharide biosynthesis/export protein